MPDDPRVQEGIRLLRARQWYRAHEAIEAAWLEAGGEEKDRLQGLIHVAVCFEHLRRGNPRGAWSQWCKAQSRLGGLRGPRWGLDVPAWMAEIAAFVTGIGLQEGAGQGSLELPPESRWPVPPEAL